MDVSQLKRIPLFEAIPDEDLKTIAPFAVSEEYPDGAVVVQEGGFSNHFYGIEDGTAKVERDGQEVGQLGPGDVFGERGLDLGPQGHQDRALGAQPDEEDDARGRGEAPQAGRGAKRLDGLGEWIRLPGHIRSVVKGSPVRVRRGPATVTG